MAWRNCTLASCGSRSRNWVLTCSKLTSCVYTLSEAETDIQGGVYGISLQILSPAVWLFGLVSIAGAAENDERDADDKTVKDAKTIEELVITGDRVKLQPWERPDRNIAGKRIFNGPYGDEKSIIAICQELKNRGVRERVSTRGISMPQTYTASSLDNYKYPAEEDCGINHFSYYEGPDFTALGYIKGPKEILLDVMTGGGPFSAPGIWGPYDQVIGMRHGMKMIMGDAAKDGLGPIKGGYAIGMQADLASYEMQDFGDQYGDVIKNTGDCLSDKLNAEAAARVLSGK
jgi:hypothetical protein